VRLLLDTHIFLWWRRGLGKLEFDGRVADTVAEEGFLPLPVELAHTDEVARLPDIHRDPFDRLLIAQARIESLTLVTVDPRVRQYPGVAFLE
jgi:PIN domain nuclease of toxin-antitoxin system